MSDQEEAATIYSLDEENAEALLANANQQLDIIVDLLEEKTKEEMLDLKVISLLCDSFSSNFHIWRILKTNLNHNVTHDKERNKNIVTLSQQDLFLTESAVMAKAFSSMELLKLNYSLSLH
jgi:hypothetical protein